MGLLDQVPGVKGLYIGGIFSIRRREALKVADISHVLSILRLELDEDLFGSFRHMIVPVDDTDDENLLEYFPATNKFIQDGLDSGRGVLVHWCSILIRLWDERSNHHHTLSRLEAQFQTIHSHDVVSLSSAENDCLTRFFGLSSAMGKSRSAACVMAYLMHKFHISPSEALAQLRESRPLCEPNGGFMEQLELYHRMSATDDIETDPVYNRWLFSREVEQSRQCGQAPDSDKIRFEDEHASGDGAAKQFSLKCRKCRRSLATSQFVLFHGGKKGSEAENTVDSSPSCAHYFVDPLSWMRPELEQGRLDGRLECPKCKTNVGKYAWQGMQCSCGDWVVPGISLARGRVDETRSAGGEEAMGIRRPPGIERSQGHL